MIALENCSTWWYEKCSGERKLCQRRLQEKWWIGATCPVCYLYIPLYQPICLLGRVFTNCPANWGSISGRVIPKTQQLWLISPCLTLSIIRYGSRVKWSNQGKGVTPSLIPLCSSYWKGSLVSLSTMVANFTLLIYL